MTLQHHIAIIMYKCIQGIHTHLPTIIRVLPVTNKSTQVRHILRMQHYFALRLVSYYIHKILKWNVDGIHFTFNSVKTGLVFELK